MKTSRFSITDEMRQEAAKEAEIAAAGFCPPVCDPSVDMKFSLFIVAIVARKYSLSEEALFGSGRSEVLVGPRHLCFHLIRKFTHFSLEEIGDLMRKDHGTVCYALRKVEDRAEVDAKFAATVAEWQSFALTHKTRFYDMARKKKSGPAKEKKQ